MDHSAHGDFFQNLNLSHEQNPLTLPMSYLLPFYFGFRVFFPVVSYTLAPGRMIDWQQAFLAASKYSSRTSLEIQVKYSPTELSLSQTENILNCSLKKLEVQGMWCTSTKTALLAEADRYRYRFYKGKAREISINFKSACRLMSVFPAIWAVKKTQYRKSTFKLIFWGLG